MYRPRLALRAMRQSQRSFAVVADAGAARNNSLAYGAAFGAAAAAAVAAAAATQRQVLSAEELVPRETGLAELSKRVCAMEVAQAGRVSSAFVFIKPHAVTDEVKGMVAKRFAAEGITILSEGPISSEKIDKELLIDNHYGAIAARAMKQKPGELVVQSGAQDEFKQAFGLTWADAVKSGKVYNLVDGAKKLGCSMSELGDKYDTLKKGTTLLKFGGGFYCGKVGDIYVINGFYARMREQFTQPGESIYYYEVEWNPATLPWADFRGKVLGGTDPKTAESSSLRNEVFRTWKSLGLSSEPNTGNNGLHASASPFEALAERTNWLGYHIEDDYFGKALLALGLTMPTIKAWCEDCPVMFEGKKQSLFDLLEDLDGREVLRKSAAIFASN